MQVGSQTDNNIIWSDLEFDRNFILKDVTDYHPDLLFSLPVDEVLGMSLREMAEHVPEYNKGAFEQWRNCLQEVEQGGYGLSFEYVSRLSSGEILLAVCRVKLSIGGKMFCCLHACNGVSDKILCKSVLHSEDARGVSVLQETGMHDKLCCMLLQYKKELYELKRRHEQAKELKSELWAGVTHEIQTRLKTIVGFSKMLCGVTDHMERNIYARIIKINNDALLKVIDNVSIWAEMEAGVVKFEPQEFDMHILFDEVALLLPHKITEPGVRTMCINPYKKCVVTLDKKRVMHILTNYITNATKYTHKGFIKVGYEYVEEGIRIYVKDSGIGIAEKNKDKVFECLEKPDGFEKGIGLGLPVCKAIAEASGGYVGFESNEGLGTAFWAWIPCQASFV